MIREPVRYVVYLRASTARQGKGGLGMDAQYAAVVEFVRQHGGTIVAQYVEVESGNRSDRPELAKALELARKGKATLLIAKLDRLARNVAFIANLMDAGIEFRACDQPFASRLTLHILAAEAENERHRISERTKAALQAAKARGVKLGSPSAAELWWRRGRHDRDTQPTPTRPCAPSSLIFSGPGCRRWSTSARPLRREACARLGATPNGGPFKCGGC